MKSLYVVALFTVVLAVGAHADKPPIDRCVVTGIKLGAMGEPYVYEHEGRTIYFCCAGCVDQFEANTEEMLKKLDRVIIIEQKKDYSLTHCVVSGEELGSHGAILDIVHDNRLVRLCGEGCLADFERDPETFMKKLDEAKDVDHDPAPADLEHE